jgi:hypothetical protein
MEKNVRGMTLAKDALHQIGEFKVIVTGGGYEPLVGRKAEIVGRSLATSGDIWYTLDLVEQAGDEEYARVMGHGMVVREDFLGRWEEDKVERALEFVAQLRARGDQPGVDFAEILEPLVEAYVEMKYRLDGLDK